MAKVKAKMEVLRKETQAEESEIKSQIEAKFKEIISPSVKKMEQDQMQTYKKAQKLAQELNQLKDTLEGFKVENILTDQRDIQSFRNFEETGHTPGSNLPDLT